MLVAAGAPAETLGITGSLLIDAQGKKSDIDVVLRNREAFQCARCVTRNLLDRKPLSDKVWRQSHERRGGTLPLDQYIWHESRKYNKFCIGKVKMDISLAAPGQTTEQHGTTKSGACKWWPSHGMAREPLIILPSGRSSLRSPPNLSVGQRHTPDKSWLANSSRLTGGWRNPKTAGVGLSSVRRARRPANSFASLGEVVTSADPVPVNVCRESFVIPAGPTPAKTTELSRHTWTGTPFTADTTDARLSSRGARNVNEVLLGLQGYRATANGPAADVPCIGRRNDLTSGRYLRHR